MRKMPREETTNDETMVEASHKGKSNGQVDFGTAITKVLIVSHQPRLGVLTVLKKVRRGLEGEGFIVDIVNVKRRNVPTALFDDLRNLKLYRDYDIILYSSFTYLSQFFLTSTKKLVFLHGRHLNDIVLPGLF